MYIRHERLSIDFVKEEFSKEGLILLETNYKNKKSPLSFLCPCGEAGSTTWQYFKKNKTKRCKKCQSETASMIHKMPFEDILSECEKNDWTLLTSKSEYLLNRGANKLIVQCKNGHKKLKSSHTLRDKRCKDCNPKPSGLNIKDYTGQKFHHWTPIRFDKVKNKKYFWVCECDCVNKTRKSLIIDNIKTGNTKSCGCYKKSLVKQNSPNWNPNLTDEQRKLNWTRDALEENKIWKKNILKRDNYTCQISGSKGSLNAHHLYAWKTYPDLRYELSNGVSLAVPIHRLFHKLYGKTGNTKEQFNLFKISYFNGEFNDKLPTLFQFPQSELIDYQI